MKTIIIGIAGGTGSGKSTFTNKLKDTFHEDVAVLYHDNYYRDQSDIPSGAEEDELLIIGMQWRQSSCGASASAERRKGD